MEIKKLIFLIRFTTYLDSILQFYNIKLFYKLQNFIHKLLNISLIHFLNSNQLDENTYCEITGWCCNSFDLVVKNNKSLKENIYREDLHDNLGKDFAYCGFKIVKQVDAELRLSLKEENGNIQKISIVKHLRQYSNLILNKNDINDYFPNCFLHKNRDFSCGYIDNYSLISKKSYLDHRYSYIYFNLNLEYLTPDTVYKFLCTIHKKIEIPFVDKLFIKLILCLPEGGRSLDTKVFYCPLCKVEINVDFNNFFEIELLDIARETREEVVLQKYVNNFEFNRINQKFYKVKNIGNIVNEKSLKTNISKIRDVQINFPDVLTKNQKLLEHDFSAVPYHGFIAGRHASIIGFRKNLEYCYINQIDNLEVENIDEGFLLTGRCPQNWYHAMIDYMPRIMFYEKLNQMPLLVSSEINPRAKEVFDIFDLTSKVKYLFPDKSYKVKNLIVPKTLSFGVDEPSLDWKNANYLNFEIIQFFYKVLKSRIPENDFYFDRVYSFRKPEERGIFNSEEIEHVLRKHDYSKIDFLELSLSDQVNILRNVSHLIAPAGAIMANLPYLKEGSNVLSLIAKHNQKALIVPTMSSFLGLNHYQFLGTSAFSDILRASSNLERIHLPYRINVKYFNKSVKEFTKKIS